MLGAVSKNGLPRKNQLEQDTLPSDSGLRSTACIKIRIRDCGRLLWIAGVLNGRVCVNFDHEGRYLRSCSTRDTS